MDKPSHTISILAMPSPEDVVKHMRLSGKNTGDDSEDKELEVHMEALCRAFEAKDPKAMAEAFKAAYDCAEEYEDESEGEDDGEEEEPMDSKHSGVGY